MAFIFFVLAVIFFILWMTKKTSTPTDDPYTRGYWDGYKAFAERVRLHVHAKSVDKSALQREIDNATGTSQQDANVAAGVGIHLGTNGEIIQPSANQTQQTVTPSSAEEQERKTLKNMNALLFMASLLFVAAGAAFIATTMPSGVKLVAMWLLVALFYGIGLLLQNTHRLKPAGIAFVGTGLGLIPFAGVTLYTLGDIPGSVAWWITSLIGIVAYLFAAMRLQSQVVSYLTIAFVISFASSFTESLSVPIVWNLVILIVISSVLGAISHFKPSWVPRYFTEPIAMSGHLVTPLVVLASVVLAGKLSLLDYELIFLVVTLQYAVNWLQSKLFWQETLVRMFFSVTVLLVAGDVANGDAVMFGLAMLVLAALQQAYSLVRYRRGDKLVAPAEWAWLHGMQALQLVTLPFWIGSEFNAELAVLSFVLIGFSSLVATLRFRDGRAALSGIFASLVLPFIVMRWVITPSLDWEYVTSWFIIAATAVLAGYYYLAGRRSLTVRVILQLSFVLYIATAFVLAFSGEVGWSVVFFAVLTVLAWVWSYLAVLTATVWTSSHKSTWSLASVPASFIFFFFVYKLYELAGSPADWHLFGALLTAATVYYIGYGVLTHLKDSVRSMGLLGATWVALTFAAMVGFFDVTLELFAALAIIAIGITVAVEGYRRKNKTLVEMAVYIASFGAQRCVGIIYEDLNAVFYAHWWAVVVGLMAWWRREVSVRVKIAAGFVTASTGIFALSEGGMYQILFLAEHVLLLIAGAFLQKRWALWWGLIASILAALYFLRDVTFLAFAFLGVVIVTIVVWRLVKMGQDR